MKFILLMLLVFIVGCKTSVSYSLITSNKSDEVIDEVQVWFDVKPVNNGILTSGISKTILDSNFKLKKQMKITWEDSNKKSHEQVFNTFDFIPEDYNGGNVIFAYQGNDKFILEFYIPKNEFPKLIDE
jgi:hypothetical protein